MDSKIWQDSSYARAVCLQISEYADTRVFKGDTVKLFLATRPQNSGNISKHLFLDFSLLKASVCLKKRLLSYSIVSLTFPVKGSLGCVCVVSFFWLLGSMLPRGASSPWEGPLVCKGKACDSFFQS